MKFVDNSILVEMRRIRKEFGRGMQKTVAVADVSLTVRCGETAILIGPSGSGKTTLLTLAAGLASPTAGELSLFGKPFDTFQPRELQKLRAQNIGFIFQTFRLLDPLTVLENLILTRKFAGAARADAIADATRLLSKLQIEHLANGYPSQLSQGEKQRVAAARAMINNPRLIIADEPTANLESKQALSLFELLHDYVKQSRCGLLVATHDQRILPFADRILRLEDGLLSPHSHLEHYMEA
ncbi:MAG: ABC transporter ATP-binding protein [Candidatus Zixiibacteriota bacterium]